MNFIQRALGLWSRIQALGIKESALRYYRSGDIHQLYGKEVGKDHYGNIYYEALPGTAGLGRERWVWYSNSKMEASTIAPEWHQWLHHVVDELPSKTNLSAFKPHYLRQRVQNFTGTDKAYSSRHYIGNKNFIPIPKKYEKFDPNAAPSSSAESL